MKNAYVLGLIGESGAGKSTLAKKLATRFNGIVISGDELGHLVLMDPYVIGQLREHFGESVIDEGHIDRKALGTIVFNDKEALEWLNGLMLPIINIGTKALINAMKMKYDLIIIDGALLIEAGIDALCQTIGYVYASEATRLQRLVNNRGIDEEKAKTMMRSQKAEVFYREHSDYVFDLSESIETIGEKESNLELIIKQISELL